MNIIKTTILVPDEPNANGRTYPRNVVEKAVQEQKEKGRTWVTMGMPQGTTVDLSEIVGQAGNWEWNENGLQVEVALMETPRGKMVKELLTAGQEFDYRPAGIGTISEDGIVSDFRFISIGVLPKGSGA